MDILLVRVKKVEISGIWKESIKWCPKGQWLKDKERKKPVKMEQKKIWGLEWEPQVKQRALLTSPVYIGQAQGEEKKQTKRGAKIESSSFLGSACLHALRILCLIKLSYNLLVHHFKSLLWGERTEEMTHSPNKSIQQHLNH